MPQREARHYAFAYAFAPHGTTRSMHRSEAHGVVHPIPRRNNQPAHSTCHPIYRDHLHILPSATSSNAPHLLPTSPTPSGCPNRAPSPRPTRTPYCRVTAFSQHVWKLEANDGHPAPRTLTSRPAPKPPLPSPTPHTSNSTHAGTMPKILSSGYRGHQHLDA